MYLINQSLIKEFFFKGELRDYCPYSIYSRYIAKTHSMQSDAMLAGSYFETLCLGGGANNSKTEDLPRKKLTAKQILAGQTVGDKKIDQIRIEQQHLIFEKQKAIHQISIQKDINTQVKIYKRFNEEVILFGELDIFPSTVLLPERGFRLCAIDLKLTGRFTDWGEYCWANPAAMDPIQGLFYHNLIRNIDLDFNIEMMPNTKLKDLYTGSIKKQIESNDALFFFWVFNYKEKELNNKFIEVKWDGTRQAELKQAVRDTVAQLKRNERNGWENYTPNYNNCSGCPVIDCKMKVVAKDEIQHTNYDEM